MRKHITNIQSLELFQVQYTLLHKLATIAATKKYVITTRLSSTQVQQGILHRISRKRHYLLELLELGGRGEHFVT